MAFDTARWPVFIVHKTFFEDESLVFRHGMNGIYSIENKKMVVDVVISVDRGDFPLSTLDQIVEGYLTLQGIVRLSGIIRYRTLCS